MRKIFLLVILIFNSICVYAKQEVVAIVNNEAITDVDFNNRVDLILKTSNLPKNPTTLNAVKWQVLQMLIDEKLCSQEAKRLNIVLDELDVMHAKQTIAANNKLSITQFNEYLAQKGISVEELENQLKHQFLWSRLIKTKIEPLISVSDQELKSTKPIKSSITTVNTDQVKLAEIVILPTKKGSEKAKYLVEQIVNELKSGGDFSALARDFSQSNTAKKNGIIGWFHINQLSRDFYSAIVNLKEGEVSQPIITNDSITIIKVLERKSETINSDLNTTDKVNDEEFKEALKQRKLDVQIKSYIKKLRSQAYIDIKYKDK